MEEIVPALEKTWIKAAQNRGLDVIELSADQKKLTSGQLNKILDVDLIYVTAFNVSIAQKLVLLRKQMFIDAPWVFQLHNQATIGMWPIYHWGMGDLLKTSDKFISTSLRDANCFNALFENKKAEVIPFPAFYKPEKNNKLKERRFCYVGRVSEQKNLHTLLWAFARYLKCGGKYDLDIIGGEDELSSPNMGIKTQGYLEILKKLCDQLNITKHVRFFGHIDRDKLHEYWKERDCVLLNASLHSDENFGMALLQGLCYGHTALITDWGGHTDFSTYFPQQVSLLSVYSSQLGPYLDVEEFKKSLLNEEKKCPGGVDIPTNYKVDIVVAKVEGLIRNILSTKNFKHEKLVHTPLLQQTLKRISFYESQVHGRIFDSYEDSLSHVYFRYYGMENIISRRNKEVLAPWCHVKDESVSVEDPHRGERCLNVSEAIKAGYVQ
jgi:hypothetical protein